MGDKLLQIDDFEIKPTTAVDEVRNHLRGDPGTPVSITFLREGVGGKVNEPQTITLERSVVRIPDVKYFGKWLVFGHQTFYSTSCSIFCTICAFTNQYLTLHLLIMYLPGFIGDPSDGIGYIDLSGFANDAGREVRFAIRALQHGASEYIAKEGAPRDESGMVAMDPTNLKVCTLQ